MKLEDVFDSVYSRLETEGIGAITHAEKVFLSVWSAGALISNGGLESYYTEDPAVPFSFTVQALNEVGLEEHAEVIRKADLLFMTEELSDDIDARCDQVYGVIDTHPDAVEQLEEEFFGLERDPLDALESYFKTRPGEFNV